MPGGERHLHPLAALALTLEAGGQEAPDDDVGSLHPGPRQDDRELVAADPERPVRAAQVRRRQGRGVAQQAVAGGVTAGVVDLLEVVDVEEGEGQRQAVPRRVGPLALHLLLERPVVAEAGQRIAQRFRSRALVGVLDDPARLLEALGGFEHAPGQPDREGTEDDRHADQTEGRHQHRRPAAPREPVDHRGGDGDRDREHRDQREEEAQSDQSQVGRLAEQVLGSGIVADRGYLQCAVARVEPLYAPRKSCGRAPWYCPAG